MSLKRPVRLLLTAAAALACVAAAPVRAQETVKADKAAGIRRLLEVTGTVKISQQMMDQMFTSMKSVNTQVPDDVWVRLRGKMRAEEMVDELIAVYDKYYTQ